MSMYLCHGCDNYIDDDYHPMEEDELCPDCHLAAQEEAEEMRLSKIESAADDRRKEMKEEPHP